MRLANKLVTCALVLVGLLAPVHGQSASPDPATDRQQGNGSPLPQPEEVVSEPEALFPKPADTRFLISGQANFIFQAHPPFHAAYRGPNSPESELRKGALPRAYLVYGSAPERFHGVAGRHRRGSALSAGLGLAGNTDLDIVRNPSLGKAPYLARAMIHKVFTLSKDKDKVENQRIVLSLFDQLPRRRLEVGFGKFSMVDFFDQNQVGSDTHFQFTNWAVDNNAAYDYARRDSRLHRGRGCGF